MSSFDPTRFLPFPWAVSHHRPARPRKHRRLRLRPEWLEARITPTVPYTVAQIRTAYGINSIPKFGKAQADGSGQSIALVVPGNDPTIIKDLDQFDQLSNLTSGSNTTLYQQYGPASTFFSVYNQTGADITANIGTSGSNGVPSYTGEILDITIGVEWAHAIAPGAQIFLVEANDETQVSRFAAITTAKNIPGISVLFDDIGDVEADNEATNDALFTTPPNHVGITFIGCSGDEGYSQIVYPASSPNVIGVGGTQLTLGANGTYGSETGWGFQNTEIFPYLGPNYSENGSWTTESGGYGGTLGTAAGGSASTASWSTSIATVDQGYNNGTEVSATWLPNASNATNATYTIYDGSPYSQQVLGRVTVNQTLAPVGNQSGSSQFQELGIYFPTSGSLSVVLDASTANGNVVADTVAIAPLWASGGGPSLDEPEPAYQKAVQNTGSRETPDVSFDGSQKTPLFAVEGGLSGYVFGSTPAAPCWAGLFAIADQGRQSVGASNLDPTSNPTQALQALYSLPASDYHDVTTGYNGSQAGPGYDDVTGLGSPVANALVPDLITFQTGRLVVTTQPPSSINVGSSFGLTVTVKEPSNATITSYNGPVTIALATGDGGTLGGLTTVTAVNGVATFSGLSLTVSGSGDQIVVTAPGETSGVSSTFNVLPGPATKLVVAAPPPPVVMAGAGFSVSVILEDAYNNVITTDQGIVTIALESGPSGSVLSGTTTQTAVAGVTNFANLSLNKVGGSDLLLVTEGAFTATLGPITVVVGAPAQLIVVQQPASLTAGVVFSIEVGVADASGNLVSTVNQGTVTAYVSAGSGPLLGTTSATVSAGLANFSNLIIDRAGTIAIRFGSSGLSGTVATETVSPAAATELVVGVQPSSTAGIGQPFAVQPVIEEEDAFGNLESGDFSTIVTASLALGNGPLLGSTTAVVTGGVAAFGNLADNRLGTITLSFAAGSLPAVNSRTITIQKATTSATWSTSSTSVLAKHPVTIIASVARTTGASPTGTVTFLDGSTILGSSAVDANGHASFTTTALALGTRSISVVYSGDTTYISTTSLVSKLYVGDLSTGDFDGDGKADIAIYDQTAATFYLSYSGGSSRVQPLGNPADKNIPVTGDFDGDGKDDLAIYDQTLSEFFVLESGGGTIAMPFGNPRDVNIPIAGDFDGDGKTDIAIYDQTAAEFFILKSAGGSIVQLFGNPKDVNIPIAGDFDGDGKTDLAIYDQSAATFFVLKSGGGSIVQSFGNPRDLNVPIAADFDGDGKTDLTIYDQTLGELFSLETGGGTIAQPFGNPADANTPLALDFDGDGKTDIAIYDQTLGELFVSESGGGSLAQPFGNAKHKNIAV